METLRQKQSRFAVGIAKLIITWTERGYEFTWGEALRSDEQAEINAMGNVRRHALAGYLEDGGYDVLADKIRNNTGNGIRNSLHEYKLAVDLNLFKNGVFLPRTEDHRPIGEWWEAQGPDHCWGGRFNDGNHYSISHGGKK